MIGGFNVTALTLEANTPNGRPGPDMTTMGLMYPTTSGFVVGVYVNVGPKGCFWRPGHHTAPQLRLVRGRIREIECPE